jgi:hypothetical protein
MGDSARAERLEAGEAAFDAWVANLGGFTGARFRALHNEALEFAGPGGYSAYLDMARAVDEEHAAGAGEWLAAETELANARSAREAEAAAAAALRRATEIRLAAAALRDDPRLPALSSGSRAASEPRVVDLVGPHGYIHGWIFVGIPGPGDEVFHPRHGHGTVTSASGNHVTVSFDAGHPQTFPIRAHQGPGHFEQMTDEELGRELDASMAGRFQGSRFRAAAGELDRRDQRAKTARVGALYAEHPKTEADRNRVYQSLVDEGEDPAGAWAHAHGSDMETMQRQAATQQLRDQGFKGASFDALARDAFRQEIQRRHVAAEAATNGYMLNPLGKRAGIDERSLFTGPESRARKYASPELKEWWDQNGRPTAADFKASLLGRAVSAGPAGGDFYASVARNDLGSVVELSTRAARLAPAAPGNPDFGTGPDPVGAEVALELRAALGLARRLPGQYRASLPPVADLARTIGLRS